MLEHAHTHTHTHTHRNRVMLWGESAGASIVTLQLVTPLSFGLYHAATIGTWKHMQ